MSDEASLCHLVDLNLMRMGHTYKTPTAQGTHKGCPYNGTKAHHKPMRTIVGAFPCGCPVRENARSVRLI